jgi:signal transduction histidine kinase
VLFRSGTGLGLSIAREIVALYSGTMSLHRSGLGGLCVRIGIPARDS